MVKSMRLTTFGWMAALLLAVPAADAASGPKGEWQKWTADTEIGNIASLQRGAANFMGYCAGCHSLGYMRYARMAKDLKIPEELLEEQLLLPGSKKTDYIKSPLAAADGEEWFGKAPPDLSLIARSKGTDYIYQFLKTFYVDPAAPSGVNNLALAGTSMPHVLSALQGLQEAKFRTVESKGPEGQTINQTFFESFEIVEPGQLTAEQYDAFVIDTVNFLDYVGEPVKAKRISLGVWVILFLLVFTLFSYLLYREYWRDVK